MHDRKWDNTAMWWNVLPPGSSPLPGPVTSQFYRIGRPRPGRVYTSQRTAAWVSFPSWQAGIRREDKGTAIRTGPTLNPAGTSRVLFSYWLLQWVRQGKRQYAQQRRQQQSESGPLRNFILWRQPMSAAQCASRSRMRRRRRSVHEALSWWMVRWVGCGMPSRKYLFFNQNIG